MKKVVIISLFDGISCGQVAAKNEGFKYDKYIAYEVNDKSIKVTQKNFPETTQMGSVILDSRYNYKKQVWQYKYPNFLNGVDRKNSIVILIGGSPCQNLSRLRQDDEKICSGLKGSKSSLFRAYRKAVRVIEPDYFIFENVIPRNTKDRDIITRSLGVEPILINSNMFSAQDRERLYWTNIPIDSSKFNLSNKNKVIKDILCEDYPKQKWIDKEYVFNGKDKKVCATLNLNYIDMCKRVYNPKFKCCTLTRVTGGYAKKKVYLGKNRIRELNPIEYERLQELPDNYTKVDGVSESMRCSLVADGWTITVIQEFFKVLKKEIRGY